MKLKQPSPVRQRFLEFLVAIAFVHVFAIALYYGLEMPQAAPDSQRCFAWIWMGVTVLAVLVGLQRIKRARRGRG